MEKDVSDNSYRGMFYKDFPQIHEDVDQSVKQEIILKLFRDDNQYAIQVKSIRSSSGSEELFSSINWFLINASFERLHV
jgi:hypothetical protein